MFQVRRWIRRLIAVFRAGNADAELTREINSHLQLIEDQFIAQGMTPEEARYAAKRAFGGVEQTKELQRDARSFAWLSGWGMDLKLGLRMLKKSPGLTVIAVIALAVAIGGGAAYLEFVNDFFRPRLSFPGGDRLVGLLNVDLSKGSAEGRSLHEFGAWKTQLTTIEELGAARLIEESLVTDDGRKEFVRGVEISASAFRVVPMTPLSGRPLIDDDEKPGAASVIVIGESLWKARFGADPHIVGRTVRFRDAIYTIVGVMPKAFGFPYNNTLWTPLRLDPAMFKSSEGPQIRIFGRLSASARLAEAQAQLESIGTEAGKRPLVKPYVESLWSNSESMWQVVALYSFNVFFIALLAICAANVATLVFARMATREAEITVRTALGASRGRIVSQLVAEALVLTSVAAAVGLTGASFGLRRIRYVWEAAQGTVMPFWWNEQLGIETIAYSILLVVLASLMVGGVPALKATGARMQERLKEAGSTGASMRFGKLWTSVIVVQVAVTVVFLLTLISLGWGLVEQKEQTADLSFPTNEYLSARIAFEKEGSDEHDRAVLAELRRRMSEDPTVINAGYAVNLPGHASEFRAELPSQKSAEVPLVSSARVGTNYFETFNQPLVAGRGFTQSEIENKANVAIVDETFVRLVLGGANAIGQQVRDTPNSPWLEIIGVVRDISLAPKKTAKDAIIYLPVALAGEWSMRIVLHTRSTDAASRLRAVALATAPQLRFTDVMTIDQLERSDAQTMRFFTSALGIVAAVALMLSTAGIYALISFTLARRTREIGIRTALGAAPSRIISSMLSRAFLQILIGVALGSIAGAALMKTGTEGSSGLGYWMTAAATVAVALFVMLVAIISCIPPVRRALKVQPTEALRTI